MLKKLLTLVLLLAAFSLKAQFGVGDWRIHPAYVGTNAQNIIDAGDKVYYLVSNNLYCFDKETLENESLNKRNSLSDVLITNIFYNPAEDQVVITYDDSNIDIITSTGKIVNMPDIKDAVIASEKNINNITFNGSLMYVATSFGYVVIDNDKFEVKESRIFNKVINSVAIVGDYIIMLQDDKLYYGLTSQHHETLSSFQTIDGTFTSGQLFPISDTKFFLNAAAFSVYTISGSGSELTFTPTQIVAAHADNIQKTPSGFLANFLAKNYYYTFDQNGGTAKRTSAGKEMFSACANGDGTLWAVGASGLHRSGDTDNYYKPDGVGMAQPFWLNYNEALGKLYVSNTTTNAFFTANSNTILYTYDGTKWEEMTPTPAFTGGSYWWEFDPEDPETYYLSAWTTGVHKVKGRERIVTYNASNSPLISKWGAMHAILRLDSQGNLWVLQGFEAPDYPVMVLPRAKVKQASVTADDWIKYSVNNIYTGSSKRASFVITQNDYKVYTDGDYSHAVVIWDNQGDIINTNPREVSFTSFTDQDENSFDWTYIYQMTEDLDGRVWLGCNHGVISFDPTQAFDSNFRINRIKVPRNDGTNLADYLLDGIQVNCIAVDGANRKWIGTNGSGLYLVSPDGSKILKQFNTTNSYLTSDIIYNVCCIPTSNSVFIATSNGLLEYFSDSTPAESDYSNVYAFPNPVKPDFTGMITIKGLMDNSYIKITDVAGNLVKSLRSNGGMATWDGCNENGDRVKTGVYFVFASQSSTSGGENSVTKIMIIR